MMSFATLCLLCLQLIILISLQCTANFLEGIYTKEVLHEGGKMPSRHAGFLTLMSVTPGGGERYFLSSALALKRLGYKLELIVFDGNKCIDAACIQNTLDALRIPLKSSDFYIHTIRDGDVYRGREFDVFYLIGNEKYPNHPPLGKFSVYMCQFPFDVFKFQKTHGKKGISYWTQYDQVIVNSRYTHDWYVQAVLQREFTDWKHLTFPFPTLTIVHPPVQPFTSAALDAEKQSIANRDKPINIAMVGRFFRGRQNKGHDAALEIVMALKSQTDRKIHLNMMGYIHPSEDSELYVQELKSNITKNGLSISIMTAVTPEDIAQTFSETTIFWHMTGVKLLDDMYVDPASFEHFGIAIVEAMYSGCIPIVPAIGGTTDIVQHDHNGFLAKHADEFAKYTLQVINSSKERVAELRTQAMRSAEKYSYNAFEKTVQSVVLRGVRSASLRKMYLERKETIDELTVKSDTNTRGFYAVMIAPGLTTHVGLTARNVMKMLGPKWKLNIFYSMTTGNDRYMREVIGAGRITYYSLRESVHTKDDYNRFLKSGSFWKRFAPKDKVLLFDTTCIMLQGIDKFLEYDFVSAPLLRDPDGMPYERSKNAKDYWFSDRHWDTKTLEGAGLGIGSGFSLRSVNAMQQIIKTYATATTDSEPEGVFFAKYAAKLGYKVASVEDSYRFAWEYEIPPVNIQALRGEKEKKSKKPAAPQLPVALHSAWMHMRADLIESLIYRNALPSPNSIDRFNATKDETVEMLKKPVIYMAPARPQAIPPPLPLDELSDTDTEGEDISPMLSGYTKSGHIGSKGPNYGAKAHRIVKPGPGSPLIAQTGSPGGLDPVFLSMSGNDKRSRVFWTFVRSPTATVGGREALMKKFDELGLISMDDLANCEKEHIEEILAMLKPVQRKKLTTLMHEAK